MIAMLGSIKKSRSDSEGRIFIELEIAPQYRLRASALAALVKTLLVIEVAPAETKEKPEPPQDPIL